MRHLPQGGGAEPEEVGKPFFLLGRERSVESAQRGGLGRAVPAHGGRAEAAERGVPLHPRRERLIGGGRQHDRQRLRPFLPRYTGHGPLQLGHAKAASASKTGVQRSTASSVICSRPDATASTANSLRARNARDVRPSAICSRRRSDRALSALGSRRGRFRRMDPTSASNSASADHRLSENSSKWRASCTSPLMASRASGPGSRRARVSVRC